MNYSVFVLGTSSFAREEHGDQKLNDLKVNQESLVHVPVPVETASAYPPGLHEVEFTSCDHLKIKKAVVLMSFMTILLRSLCFELLINPNKEFDVFPGSVKIIKQIMKKVFSCSLRVLILRLLFSKLKLPKTGGRKHFHCHPNSTWLYCLKGAARKSEGWRSQVTSFSGWAQTEEDRKVTGSDCRFTTVFKVVIVGNFLVKWTTAIIIFFPPWSMKVTRNGLMTAEDTGILCRSLFICFILSME